MKKATIDDVLDIIGPFNKYQWYLMLLMSYCMLNMGLQGLTMTFIANDPGWICVENSTACNYTGIFEPNSNSFGKRCTLNRKDWRFSKRTSSIVSEVNEISSFYFLFDLLVFYLYSLFEVSYLYSTRFNTAYSS